MANSIDSTEFRLRHQQKPRSLAVRELRERARRIMETGEGLERITGTQQAQQKLAAEKIN
jgi:hypothetical protein